MKKLLLAILFIGSVYSAEARGHGHGHGHGSYHHHTHSSGHSSHHHRGDLKTPEDQKPDHRK